MQSPSASKWPSLAALGLLLAVGAVAVCKTTPSCYLGIPQRQEALTPMLGEKDMPVTQTPSQVHHATEANFRDLVLRSKVPVLVDFYADWCRPCQRLAPLLEELAAETSAAKIVKVNVDHNPDLAAEYGISSIPSLKVFRNGKVSDQLVGLADKNQLRAMLVP